MGVLFLLVCLMVTIVFGFMLNFRTNTGTFFIIVTWLVLLACWAAGSRVLFHMNEKSKYILEENSLTVYKGQIIGVSKEIFRYDSMLSVQVQQKSLEAMMGYGDITITIPKLDNPVVLKDVDDPANRVQDLKDAIAKHGNNKNSLVA